MRTPRLQERQEELHSPQVKESILVLCNILLSKALPTDLSVLFMTLHLHPGRRRRGEGWSSTHTLCFKPLISFLLGTQAALSIAGERFAAPQGSSKQLCWVLELSCPLNDSCQEICHQQQPAQRVSKHLSVSRNSSGRIALMMEKKI